MPGLTKRTSDDQSNLEVIKAAYDALEAPAPSAGMEPKDLIAFRQSDEGKALAAWVKEKFTKCKTIRDAEERQWNQNLAMYNGQQWAEFYGPNSPNYGKLGNRQSGSNRTRLTINRIKPICRTEQAKFLSQRPGASIVPATDEDEDILAAQAGEQLWYATSERRELASRMQEAVFWKVITGNGFIKTVWRDNLVDEANPDLSGDIEYLSISPYQMYIPDVSEKDLQKQPFIIQAFAESTERLKLRYSEALAGMPLRSTTKESSIQEQAYASPRGARKQEGNEAFDANMVYECWVRPGECTLLPQGGMVILVDSILVDCYNEGMPYKHDQFPFTHLPHIDTERFWRTSIIEDLAELQVDYNKLRSQIAETRKKMGRAQILAPKGSVTASKWTSEIGQLIEYKFTGGPAPQPMPLQNIPQYILQEVEYVLRDFEDISGQHEVTKGQTPPGVTAATAIAYLQESDDSYLLPSFKNLERAYGQIARQTLLLFTQFWDAPRLVKVVGKDDAFSTLLLDASDVARATDVRIEPGSALPQSKAARQAFIMDLMMNGFVPPNEGLDMLEIGGKQKLMDLLKNDVRQAQRENIKFKRITLEALMEYQQQVAQIQAEWPKTLDEMGQLVPPPEPPLLIPVHDWDNHQVHIEEHNRWRRTQEFELLPPEIQQLVQQHVEQHTTMMNNQMVQNFLQQMPTDGSVEGVSGVTEGGAPVDFQSLGQEGNDSPSAAPETPSEAEPSQEVI